MRSGWRGKKRGGGCRKYATGMKNVRKKRYPEKGSARMSGGYYPPEMDAVLLYLLTGEGVGMIGIFNQYLVVTQILASR